jgi:hypothetical protein
MVTNEDWEAGVWFLTEEGKEIFSICYHIQTGYGAHPASYQMGNSGSFLEVKRPEREANHSLPTHPHQVPRLRIRRAIPPHPVTSSWRGD